MREFLLYSFAKILESGVHLRKSEINEDWVAGCINHYVSVIEVGEVYNELRNYFLLSLIHL